MPEGRLSKQIARLTNQLIARLETAIEAQISHRAQSLAEDSLRKSARRGQRRIAAVSASLAEPPAPAPSELGPEPSVTRPRQPRPSRRRPAATVAVAPALTIDPDEQRRTAELARLRAILRPTAPAPAPAATPLPVVPPPRREIDEDRLQALEDHIRERIPTLSGLSQSRCTAQIAAWVGRVRLYQHEFEPERARLASRILLDKLRNLAWSMEAGKIEGLDLSWSTRHWQRYIDENELIVSTSDAAPQGERPDVSEEASVWAAP